MIWPVLYSVQVQCLWLLHDGMAHDALGLPYNAVSVCLVYQCIGDALYTITCSGYRNKTKYHMKSIIGRNYAL